MAEPTYVAGKVKIKGLIEAATKKNLLMSLLDDIYNQFDPSPLPAGSPVYVDCKAVRGGTDVLIELGRKIQRQNQPTCQLYTGHRGGGKSTELKRLQKDLDRKGFFTVYFSAEDEDINPEDVEYADILLACTRHLLEGLHQADSSPVLNWLRERWQALNDILKTEISLDKLSAEAQIQQFAKITASIRTQPSQRYQIRQLLNPYTETLVNALNEFIRDAKTKLPQNTTKLVVIADGLEKVTLISREGGRTNHDEIFIDRSEQLKSLDCHVIYTVPISLVLSSRASDLMEIYNCAPQVLPMIKVRTRDDQLYSPGIDKLKEIIQSRVRAVEKAKKLFLETEVFDSPKTLERLCSISGGHVRNLILLMQLAIDYNEDYLPITAPSLQQAIRQLRKTYRDTVNDNQWTVLAKVYRTKRIPHDEQHRSLLFTRCLLEYLDDEETWHDVHPALLDVPEFKDALIQLLPL